MKDKDPIFENVTISNDHTQHDKDYQHQDDDSEGKQSPKHKDKLTRDVNSSSTSDTSHSSQTQLETSNDFTLGSVDTFEDLVKICGQAGWWQLQV